MTRDFEYRVRRCVRIGDLQIDETEHSTRDAPLPRHFHERALIALPIRGVVVSHGAGGRARLLSGAISFLPPGETHAVSFDTPNARIFSVEVGHHWLCATLGSESASFIDRVRSNDSWIAGAVVRLYRRFSQNPLEGDLTLEEHVMDIVARQRTPTRVRVHRQPPPWLRNARDLVVDKPCEAWRFRDLATVVGVHPVTLSRAFAETYGRTLSSFVQQRRVAWARTALTNSDLPVGGVALAAGFSDHAHFSRTFRRLVGMTPTAYRDALRPDHRRPTHVGALRRERSGVRPARSLPASDSRIFAV